MQARQYRSGGRGEESLVYFTMPEMIKAAKEAVVKACEDGEERGCLGPVELTPYKTKGSGSSTCLMRFWALQGTPMRGIVIANYGIKEVMAFDAHNRRLKIKIRIRESRKTISRV